MKIRQLLESATGMSTASIATAPSKIGKMQKRQKPTDNALDKGKLFQEADIEESDPCWKDYKQIGMKKKGGKSVPNCVPKEGVAEGSGPKEKQKTPYRDINSPEYKAAADKQKQRMDKDKAAEPGKKMLAKQGVAEGADDKFSVADKVEDLVNQYKLFDKRGWTDLFTKLAGRKLEVAEIRREMEYASKFLQLLDSIRMRSDYRGQQDPRKDQELIDLSNQWLSLFNKATSEFKGMNGKDMAEGSLNEGKGLSGELAGFLKSNGFKGPYRLGKLPKWAADLSEFDKNSLIMVQGNDVEYDEFVLDAGFGELYMGGEGGITKMTEKAIMNSVAYTSQGVAEGGVDENKKGVRAVKHTVKPRNFVAKNAVQSGAGAHKDKKKAQKQGDTKHKNKEPAYESKLWAALGRRIIK
jgi:hypothetical protein